MSYRITRSLRTANDYSAVFEADIAEKVAQRLSDARITHAVIDVGTDLTIAESERSMVAIQVDRSDKNAMMVAVQAVWERHAAQKRAAVEPGDAIKGMRTDDFMSAGNLYGFLATCPHFVPVYFDDGAGGRTLIGESELLECRTEGQIVTVKAR